MVLNQKKRARKTKIGKWYSEIPFLFFLRKLDILKYFDAKKKHSDRFVSKVSRVGIRYFLKRMKANAKIGRFRGIDVDSRLQAKANLGEKA